MDNAKAQAITTDTSHLDVERLPIAVHQQVVGLEVKVDDGRVLRVKVGHPAPGLHRDLASLLERRPPLGRPELPRERAAADKVGHDAGDDERLVVRLGGRLKPHGTAVLGAVVLGAAVQRPLEGLDDDAVHADDVGMVELGQDLGFAHERLGVLGEAIPLRQKEEESFLRIFSRADAFFRREGMPDTL